MNKVQKATMTKVEGVCRPMQGEKANNLDNLEDDYVTVMRQRLYLKASLNTGQSVSFFLQGLKDALWPPLS